MLESTARKLESSVIIENTTSAIVIPLNRKEWRGTGSARGRSGKIRYKGKRLTGRFHSRTEQLFYDEDGQLFMWMNVFHDSGRRDKKGRKVNTNFYGWELYDESEAITERLQSENYKPGRWKEFDY